MRRGVLLLAVVIAAVYMGRGIALPWSYGNHNGWGGAFYSNIARNYLRYGYVETRLAPVVSTGERAPEERVYYLTHPPLIGLAVSLGFRLLGEHEWVARLVPLAFSLGSILLLYRLAAQLLSPRAALVAVALFAFAPAQALYGAHVDPQGPPVVFFGLLLLLAYLEDRPWLAVFALALGTGFDWPVLYLAGLLAVHAALAAPRRLLWTAGLLGSSIVLGAAFFLYANAVAPEHEQHYLESKGADAFLFWTGWRADPNRIPGRSIELPGGRAWLERMAGHLRSLFTAPLLLLGFGGAIAAGSRGFRAYLWLLLGWGLVHIALFPLGAYVHDYWSIYLSPGLALGAAAAWHWIAERAPRGRGAFVSAPAIAFAAALLWVGIHRVDALPREPATLGKSLHELTRPDDDVLMLSPLDARDAYYADRRIRDRVNSVRGWRDALAEDAHYRLFVVPESVYRERTRKPLFELLRTCCPSYSLGEYRVFDLRPATASYSSLESAGTSRS